MGIAELPTPRLTLSFWGRSRVPLVLQSETSECALACLSMVAAHHGLNMDLATLRRRWTPSPRGTTLAQMMAMAADLHLVPRALRLELNQIARLRLPAILHWDLDHFVVLEEASARGAWVVDPAIGRRRLPLHEVSRHFTGIALELRPAEHFRKRRDVERLPLASFFARAQGLGTALGRILVLSLALQVFVVLAPLFGQIVIDEIVVSGDRPLLTVLGVGFLLIVGIHACLSGVRGWMVAVLGASLQLGWGARLFHHLIRLPLCWFERRHMGDVVSRFQSIRAIEALVAGTMVEAVVDGLMACTTLAVMLLYSPVLAGISMLAVTLYLAVRLALYGPLRRASTEALVLGARADSLFMESVRAILPLKNHGAEAVRECAWQNRRAQALDADLHVGQLEILRQIANTAVFGAEGVVILWLGAILVLSGEMTAGMLVAFVAYKGQFASRAALLVDSWLDVRLVSVHLERLADIALEPGDPGTQAAIPLRVRGALAARDLWFRYAGTEPYVVAGVDLDIAAGECVAITGPSGMGKTTLVKLLMGLLEPSCGSILVDGGVLRSGSVGSYRRQVAAVMQDDVLLSGTLADNISLFDADRDQRWMETCAELAAVHEDIMQMPMGYLTCVGDMGSMLSGGQRQRICLARALYSRPRILFLDEATSHVDPTVEYRIFEGLRELGMTRVVVAHRQETLCAADRVIALQRRDGDP